MNCYETLFVLKPTLTDEETAAQITKIKDVLEKENAEFLATDEMGMRKLAYPVQKCERGYYTIFFYKAEGSSIAELERNLKINEEVIKFLTVRYNNTTEMNQFNKMVDVARSKANTAIQPAETAVPETAVPETAVPETQPTPEPQAAAQEEAASPAEPAGEEA